MIFTRLKSRGMRQAVILLYHRIATLSVDPWSLAVTPRHFEEQLSVLRESFSPIGLSELLARFASRRVPRRAVVLTFDDGYTDILSVAKPLLSKHDVPATLFAVASTEGTFWWDDLARLVIHGRFASGQITLSIRGEHHVLDLSSPPVEVKEEIKPGCSRMMLASPRITAYREAWRLLRDLQPEERKAVLAGIEARSVVEELLERAARLSDDGLRQLRQEGLLEVGSHTLSHPFLPSLSVEDQQREIAESKRVLQEYLGEPVRSFAYPFGAFSAQTVGMVSTAGYACACTTDPAVATARCNPYALPRVVVDDSDGDQLKRRLLDLFSEDRAR